MELGEEIRQLRKLSGMTQEQLAEKLNVSRQALSKWENDSSTPDLESMVKLSALFQVSLDELLMKEERMEERKTQITLEDLTKIQEHNRKMNVLLVSGILLVAIGVMMLSFVMGIQTITVRMMYVMYRYIAVGEYAYTPIPFYKMLIPGIAVGGIGAVMCIVYLITNRRK